MFPFIKSWGRKRLLILSVLTTLLFPFAARGQFSGAGAGTANDPYLIFNPAQLNQVRNYLNNPDVYFSLGADIDLTEWISRNQPSMGWLPIGNPSSPFKGKFLGNSHKISGVRIDRTTNYNGLFGVISGATVNNLTIEADIDGASYCGALAGQISDAIVKNVNVSATIKGGSMIGGLAGVMETTTISDCYASSQISASGSNIGGFVGYLRKGNTSSCSAFANISAGSSSTSIGGFSGQLEINNFGEKTQKSYYYNDVITYPEKSASNTVTLSEISAIGTINGGREKIGGIVGTLTAETNSPQATSTSSSSSYFFFYNGYVDLKDCKSSIEIRSDYASQYVSGLIGFISSTGGKTNFSSSGYTKVASSKKPEITILSCYSIGDIITPKANNVGGIIGNSNATTLYDTYFAGNIVGNENVGGISGMSANIYRSYTSANISGAKYIGGIMGKAEDSDIIRSCFVLSPIISASQQYAGRIYGYGKPTCGNMGTSATNYSMVETKISVNGSDISYNGTAQDGDVSSIETMKMRATYQGLGWDFSKEWTLLETECLPYKINQTAPPQILSVPTSGSFMISGKSLNGGKVFIDYGGQIFTADVTDNTWTVRTDPLKAGEKLNVWAESDDKFRSYSMNYTVAYPGTGTEEDPYLIYTANDLANINSTGYYKLMNDIDLSGIKWNPIGRTSAVMSVLDGDNHTIKGLNVEQNSTNFCGLFSSIAGATIKNLTIENPTVKGGDYCGVIAGSLTDCRIENVDVVNATVAGQSYSGGIAGKMKSTVITKVTASGSIESKTGMAGGIASTLSGCDVSFSSFNGNVAGQNYVGGITGQSLDGSIIAKCCTEGNVEGLGNNAMAGGIAGSNSSKSITDCFSTATVSSTGYCGGIVGINYAEIARCYAAGDLTSDTLAAGISAYNDGSNAIVKSCAAAIEKISISSQTGNAMRVIGGVRNGASIPSTADNVAFASMIVSVNGVPQDIYEDPMNGANASGDSLRAKDVYTSMGWKFPSVWTINGSAMPELAGLTGTGASRNDNYIYSEPYETSAGEIFDLTINLKNKDLGTGFQFDMTLPEGMEIYQYYDEDEEEDVLSIFKGSRLTRTHNLLYKKQPTGAMRVICTSSRVDQLIGDNGEVIRFKIKVSDNVVNGNYNIRFNNVMLDSKGVNIFMANASVPVKVTNDKLSAEPMEVMRGKSGELLVGIDNKSEITGMQFDLFLPEGIEISRDADNQPKISLGSRGKSSHIIINKELESGAHRVIVYASDAVSSFEGNSGDVIKIELNVPESMETGNYFATFKNVFLSNKELKSVECADLVSQITVTRVRRKGDVNVDGVITGSDIACGMMLALNQANNGWDVWAADINENGSVEMTDTKLISYLALDEVIVNRSNARKYSRRKAGDIIYTPTDEVDFHLESFSIMPGETKEVKVYLNNPTMKVSAVQWDVRLPEGLSFVYEKQEGSEEESIWYEENDARTAGNFMFATVHHPDQGIYSMMHLNIMASNYKKRTGSVLTFKVKADESLAPGVYTARRENMRFLDDVDATFCTGDEEFSVIVGNAAEMDHIELKGHLEDTEADAIIASIAGNENLLSLDISSLKSIPEGKVLNAANPNAIVYTSAASSAMTDAVNKVTDGVCNRLVLTDGHSFGFAKEFTADEVIYEREMNAGEISTLYLPFINEEANDVEFHTENGIDKSSMEVLYSPSVHSAYEAMIIVAKNSGLQRFFASNVTFSPADMQADENHLFGNFLVRESDEDVYFVNNGKLEKTRKLEPFRGYFDNQYVSGVVSGIESVIGIDENAEIYTVTGIRVNEKIENLQPGIYVIGGKKVLVK